MTNLNKMIQGVEFTTSLYKRNFPSITEAPANAYSADRLYGCYFRSSNWSKAYTHESGIRDNMKSLSQYDIKNELLKHEVCYTAYNRQHHIAASKYMGTIIYPGLSDYEISAALYNILERGFIEQAYAYLDDENILKGSISRFVETINNPERRVDILSMPKRDSFVGRLTDNLDKYYMVYRPNPQDNGSMTGGYGSR